MTILLRVQGLGANWLGCYGNEWVATPHLDRLAANGTVFDNHYAESLPEFDPFPEEVPRIIDQRDGGPPLQFIRKNLPTLSDGLTILESDAFAPPWHVPRELFKDYWDYDDKAKPILSPVAEDNWRILQASYAAALTYFDAEFGALRAMLSDATWIVTSTHGFPLGEHSTIGGFNLNEECVHLPLILSHGAGVRIAEFTSPNDLATIATEKRLLVRKQIVARTATQRSIRTAEWTMIDGDPPRLYVRPSDRFEINDVARLHPDVIEDLLARRASEDDGHILAGASG